MTQKTEYCNGVLIFESNASDLRNVNCNVFVLSPDAPGGNNLLICNDTRRDWQCPKIAAYGKRPSRATLYHAIQKFVTDNPAPAPFIPRNAPRRDRPRQGDGRMMRTVPLQTNRRSTLCQQPGVFRSRRRASLKPVSHANQRLPRGRDPAPHSRRTPDRRWLSRSWFCWCWLCWSWLYWSWLY